MKEFKPIRVLHCVEAYLNITENWIFRLFDHLSDTEVVIASKKFLRCNFYPSKFEYIEFPIKPIDRNLYGFPVRLFNKVAYNSLRYYPLYVAKMVGEVDLMHSHFANVGWEYLDLATRLKIPHVVSFYGLDYEYLPYVNPVWKERYKILFQQADLFFCEGAFGAQTLEKMGCPSEKIKVARLGVEVENIPFYMRSKQAGELSLLQIASFTEKKGHLYAVQAFIDALKECPNMTLTLVGREAARGGKGILPKLKQMIKGTLAEKRISFIGQIDFNELHAFMKDYQVFIHPSCHSATMDCEGGAPIVILDAQATGIPVISTTHCDISDEVISEVTGFLTPEKDVIALTKSIERFYRMGNNEYQNFSLAARRHTLENYDAANNAALVNKIYNQVIDNSYVADR